MLPQQSSDLEVTGAGWIGSEDVETESLDAAAPLEALVCSEVEGAESVRGLRDGEGDVVMVGDVRAAEAVIVEILIDDQGEEAFLDFSHGSIGDVVIIRRRCAGGWLILGFRWPEVHDDAVFTFGTRQRGGDGIELLGIDAEEDAAFVRGEAAPDVACAAAFFPGGVGVFTNLDTDVVCVCGGHKIE